MVGMKPRAAISWSGGKDSCAALLRARSRFDVVAMITMVDETGARSRSHGLRPEVLDAQAEALGLARIIRRCDWTSYNDAFSAALSDAASAGITHVVFGDILFDEHKQWAEAICRPHGMTAVEPLWGASTAQLFAEWTASANAARIVTARASVLDQSWLGRTLTADMVPEFDRLGVDHCGERGEYHTVVTDCELFRTPIAIVPGQSIETGGCWALDVTVDRAARG
jgi:uncharacterized protein (TIGR00290 family)